jgi:hypothetical protein
MAIATVPPVPTLPQVPPIPPKSEARKRVIIRPSQEQGVVVKRTRPNPRTYEDTDTRAFSEASIQLESSLDQLRISSAPAELIGHDERLPEPISPEGAQIYSTWGPGVSSSCADTTITIDPSKDLQAMQTVGSDAGSFSHSSTWHHSTRYLRQSQTSLLLEVYLPTGCPPWLVGDLTSLRRPPSPSGPHKLEVKNWNHESDSPGPDTTATDPDIYGPSSQDIHDLITRRTTWNDEQEQDRKPLTPLQRIVSLSKEISGELKRKLSIRSVRQSFEARLEREDLDGPMRCKSEKRIGVRERLELPHRSNTVGARGRRKRLTKRGSGAVRWEGVE